jgi:hypothetical protein
MSETEWSKQEKEIARRAFKAAYSRECKAIAESVRKMTSDINDPIGLWQLHDYLTEKRKETDEKYDYRYRVLLFVFARLMHEGWVQQEDLAGISDEKLHEIRKAAEFMSGS